MNNLIVILGPTASGKTNLAVKIANEFNGEIISADSRQIYQGMDIGTGKDLKEYSVNDNKIHYHLIDILNPSKDYSVFQFKKDFYKAYDSICSKNKISILCGGTGLYIESVLLNYMMPEVSPNISLRKKLEKFDLKSLIIKLKKIDKDSYLHNYHITKRRLIRQIEKLKAKDVSSKNINRTIDNPLVIGISLEKEKLHNKIEKRLSARFKEGLIDEVKSLISNGLNPNRLKYFGLEYKIIGEYLFENLPMADMQYKLNKAINKFSKRQMTFFRRMEKRGIKIDWYEKKDYTKIKNLINNYL